MSRGAVVIVQLYSIVPRSAPKFALHYHPAKDLETLCPMCKVSSPRIVVNVENGRNAHDPTSEGNFSSLLPSLA
jgi:hypothetical protein